MSDADLPQFQPRTSVVRFSEEIIKQAKTTNVKSFKELTDFVKVAATKVFGDAHIASVIRQTIIDEDYGDVESMLDDIDNNNQGHIIMTISNKLKSDKNNKNISYQWTEKQNATLHGLLIKIYKNKIINKNAFDPDIPSLPLLAATQESVPRSQDEEHKTFVDNVLLIIKDINLTMRKPINIPAVEQLFMNEKNLNKISIFNTSISNFGQTAKKYNIKGHHATRILTKLRSEFENNRARSIFNDEDKQGLVMVDDDYKSSAALKRTQSIRGKFDGRRQWRKGSK
eukprot:35835_1